MKNKVSTLEQCIANVKDGQTILFGDWHGELSAEEVITGVLEKGVKDIEAIAVSGGMPDQGVGRLIVNKQVKTLRCDFITGNLKIIFCETEPILQKAALNEIIQMLLRNCIEYADKGIEISNAAGLGGNMAQNTDGTDCCGHLLLGRLYHTRGKKNRGRKR